MEQRTKYIILILFFAFLTGIFLWYRGQQPVQEEYQFPSPEDVVRLYFTAWNEQRYADMYSTIADDFKRNESTANNLTVFRSYIEQQQITRVALVSVQQISHDGVTAQVMYDVRFTQEDTILPLQGTFVLGNKQADIILGWKILQPYGGSS